MHLLKGIGRLTAFWLLFALFFAANGGHVSVLRPWVLWLGQGLIFVAAIVFYSSFRRPRSKDDLFRLRLAGRIGFWLAVMIPIISAALLVLGDVDQGRLYQTIGFAIVTVLVAVANAALIYFSIFVGARLTVKTAAIKSPAEKIPRHPSSAAS